LSELPVVIAGGGPVGLTLAIDLAYHGVHSVLLEQDSATTGAPKCTLTSTRSMEHYRRLGLVDVIRAAGIYGGFPNNIVFATRLTGHEIVRFDYPSRHDAERLGTPTAFGSQYGAETPQRISQMYLEPVLRIAAEATGLTDVQFDCCVDRFEQDDSGVTVHATDLSNGKHRTIRASYLVGCDGAGSEVRGALDINMIGERALSQQFGIFFQSKQLREVSRQVESAIVFVINPEMRAALVSINGDDLYSLQVVLPADADTSLLDPRALVRAAVGIAFEFEVLRAEPWSAHLLVAERYRSGRVFLAGDSAHLLTPTGGFGMNTGIGDAVDLAWKIAATLEGWGGEALLASYEAERRPIAERNIAQSRLHAAGVADIAVPPAIEHDGDGGSKLRRSIGETILERQRPEFESAGAQLGYRYDASAIVVPDGTPQPSGDEVTPYTPNTRPGSRAPHVMLADGSSMLDLFGHGFTLLRFDHELHVSAMERAAAMRGVLLAVVDIGDAAARELYERPLVLVRPDGHVAWRGASAPDDCEALIDTVRGAGVSARVS
jgi:2-polyprenyl-6-methoxyphenol hydroxylase-like FAD-dependent oxidoreductase